MHCPNCKNDITPEDYKDNSNECKKCGALYDEYFNKIKPLENDIKILTQAVSSINHEKKRSKLPSQVVVTDIEMSFGSMVMFMVKWVFAMIPAVIIIIILGFVGFFLLGELGEVAINILMSR